MKSENRFEYMALKYYNYKSLCNVVSTLGEYITNDKLYILGINEL